MYNQILLCPDCLCSRLLLGCKKCAAKVICSFSGSCLWRVAEDSFFLLILWWFSICFPVSFPFKFEMELGEKSKLITECSFHSVTHSADKSVDVTGHYIRLQLCRCTQLFHSNTSLSSFCPLFSQIIWKQWSLQRLWSVNSSQWTGDESTGQRVPSQGNVYTPSK